MKKDARQRQAPASFFDEGDLFCCTSIARVYCVYYHSREMVADSFCGHGISWNGPCPAADPGSECRFKIAAALSAMQFLKGDIIFVAADGTEDILSQNPFPQKIAKDPEREARALLAT